MMLGNILATPAEPPWIRAHTAPAPSRITTGKHWSLRATTHGSARTATHAARWPCRPHPRPPLRSRSGCGTPSHLVERKGTGDECVGGCGCAGGIGEPEPRPASATVQSLRSLTTVMTASRTTKSHAHTTWPFENGDASKQSGRTSSSAMSDKGKAMRQWHAMAGIPNEKRPMVTTASQHPRTT